MASNTLQPNPNLLRSLTAAAHSSSPPMPQNFQLHSSSNPNPKSRLPQEPNNPLLQICLYDPSARCTNKKRKLLDKQIPDHVAALLPESALYTHLLEFDSRVDGALVRKKVDIQ